MNKHYWSALAIMAFIFQSCDNRESLVKKSLMETVTSESKSTLRVDSFEKTNGYDQIILGVDFYNLEWTAVISTNKTLWKISPDKFNPFYWSNFQTSTTNPEGQLGTFRLPVQCLAEAAKIRLTGRTSLQMTDNGWRANPPKVLSAKVLSGLLRSPN